MFWSRVFRNKLFQSYFPFPFLYGNFDETLTMSYYAVAKGRTTGIFMSWAECEAQVKGFSGARYKKFNSVDAAQDFIQTEAGGNFIQKSKSTTSKFNPNSSGYSTLKRNYSTSSKSYLTSNSRHHTSDSSDSDLDSDLTTIINKQMDDIEKRLKESDKSINKIINSASHSRKSIMIEPPQPKKRRSNSNREFEVDEYGYVKVYTDGACSANGKKSARAGLGVYWGDGHPLNISKPVSGRATNNSGEIQAATWAIRQALQNGVTKLAINTDSKFLIDSVTKWMPGWKHNGWKLKSGGPVKNEVDFKELDSLQNKLDIKWNYVEAHKGIPGNEKADQLAREGAAMYKG